MNTYRILHPLDGMINHYAERGKFEYETICTVQAKNLNDAFILGQNDFSEEYAELGKRSTSVGDIIIDDSADAQEYPLGKHYFVMGVGFQEIPATVSQYIDWGNHVHDIDETDLLIFNS